MDGGASNITDEAEGQRTETEASTTVPGAAGRALRSKKEEML